MKCKGRRKRIRGRELVIRLLEIVLFDSRPLWRIFAINGKATSGGSDRSTVTALWGKCQEENRGLQTVSPHPARPQVSRPIRSTAGSGKPAGGASVVTLSPPLEYNSTVV